MQRPPDLTRRDLTPRQQNILDFVAEYQGEHGFPPSIREIGEFFGIRSTNGVSDHLRALEKKGVLSRTEHQSRSLQLVRDVPDPGQAAKTQAQQKTVEPRRGARPARPVPVHGQGPTVVPMLGRVAAGQPMLAVAESEDTVVVDSFLLGGPGEVFGLRVVGESMIDAGILPGDFLFVRRRSVAESGAIVVAMIDGEATVKRFFPEGDVLRFQPENKAMKPIFVRKSDFAQCDLLGTVVGIYRKLV